ncbi:MAG: hypothetical protein KAS32_04995 [Candidatus Peribacteraceae bacterium]|nr:hypothetical protein [Candidatus Peribacteraceae bacterium]
MTYEPDLREAFEYNLCRLRNVYKTVTASKTYYCDQCQGVIEKGEEYDSIHVSNSGVGGYIRSSKVHRECRKDYIDRRNQRYAEMHNILLSICWKCGLYLGYKDGDGTTGLSGTVCEECEKVWMAEVK